MLQKVWISFYFGAGKKKINFFERRAPVSRGGGGGVSDEVRPKRLRVEKGKCEITAKENLHHLICFLRIISVVANAAMFFLSRFSSGGCVEVTAVNEVHFLV